MLLREMKQKHSEHLKAIKALDKLDELDEKQTEELETRMTECEGLAKKIERRNKLELLEPQKTIAEEIPKSEKRSYSLTKAIEILIKGKAQKGSCFEQECHEELEKRSKSDGGFLVPQAEIFGRPKLQVEKRLVDNQQALVSDPIKPELYLPALYEASIIGALGVRQISATGDFNFPRGSKTTAGWISGDGEGADSTLSTQDQTFTSTSVTPKFLGAITGWSLRQLKQMSSNLSLEGILRENLVQAMAEKLDDSLINATGASPQPSGFLHALGSATNNTALALKSSSPVRKWTWSDLADIKQALRTQYKNHLLMPKFLISPLTEKEWSIEQRFPSSDGDSLLESAPGSVVVSSHIADTKVLYGAWHEFCLTTFDSIELSLGMIDDDFSKGNQRLRAIGCFDFFLNRKEGFRQITITRT